MLVSALIAVTRVTKATRNDSWWRFGVGEMTLGGESSRERHKRIIGRGHDLRLGGELTINPRLGGDFDSILVARLLVASLPETSGKNPT